MAGQKRNTQQSQSPSDLVEEEEALKFANQETDRRNPREDDDTDEDEEE